MTYQCPVCNLEMTRELKTFLQHTYQHIEAAVLAEHPRWNELPDAHGRCERYLALAKSGSLSRRDLKNLDAT